MHFTTARLTKRVSSVYSPKFHFDRPQRIAPVLPAQPRPAEDKSSSVVQAVRYVCIESKAVVVPKSATAEQQSTVTSGDVVVVTIVGCELLTGLRPPIRRPKWHVVKSSVSAVATETEAIVVVFARDVEVAAFSE